MLAAIVSTKRKHNLNLFILIFQFIKLENYRNMYEKL